MIISVLFCTSVSGQQLPVYSAYVHNPYVLNPAVTGYGMFMDFSLHGKKQWLGMENGPFNQNLSVHSSINQHNFGVGGSVFNDDLGVIKNYGFSVSSAYHLKVGDEAKLGVGMSGRFAFYGLDKNEIILADQGDGLIDTRQNSGLVPDVSVGFLLHRGDYMIGLSAQNILQSSADFGNMYGVSNLRHFNFMAYWNTLLSNDLELIPSVFAGYVEDFPVFMDFRVLARLNGKFDFELGYKTNKDLVIGLGMEIKEDLRINYNYDLVLGGMRVGTSGSHELVLSYDFYYNPAYKKDRPRYKWIRKGPKPSIEE